jgi:glutathione S-transferase
MQLYYAETANPRKPCAVAKYLGLPIDYVYVALDKGEHKQPAYLAKNPNGRVPLLIDGDTSLWESAAIAVYLAAKAGSDLWPRDDGRAQAEVMRWVSWDAFHFLPYAGALYFEHLIKPQLGLGAPDPAAVEAARTGFHTSAKVLERHLTGRRFLLGDRLTVADFVVGVLLPYEAQIHLPLTGYEHLQRWRDGLMSLSAFRDPWPH